MVLGKVTRSVSQSSVLLQALSNDATFGELGCWGLKCNGRGTGSQWHVRPSVTALEVITSVCWSSMSCRKNWACCHCLGSALLSLERGSSEPGLGASGSGLADDALRVSGKSLADDLLFSRRDLAQVLAPTTCEDEGTVADSLRLTE